MKNIKKLFTIVAVGLIAVTGLLHVGAVSTNGSATPWTREKAEHLARKTLFGPTPALVDQLVSAGSASAAVAILFPSTAPSTTQFDAEMDALVNQPGFDQTSRTSMNKYYQLKLYRNPYEAKQKLAMLFYDMWAVNRQSDIEYADIVEQHELIDQYLFGDYRTTVKNLVFTDGGRGDYAMGEFVDLFRLNVNFPNENYARELLQLFLMGEYKPFESAENGDTPNYTDEDVIALARKMTGLEDDPVTHQVTFNPLAHNYSTGLHLLTGPIAPGYNLPFYDPVSDTLDFGAAITPVNGNNGLFDNTINYLFAKRETEISLFLAHKLFTYYIHENPTPAQITTFATQIRANNFSILDSVTYLLATDWMYENASMNTPYYKNPLDLMIGTLKVLNQYNPNAIHESIYDQNLLATVDWEPFYPGSVFGRDGFDRNADWINQYTYNQRLIKASQLVFYGGYGSWTGGVALTGSNGLVTSYTGTTATGLVDYLQETLYIGQTLSTGVQSQLINYVTSGGTLTFDLTDQGFVDTRVRGLVAQMLMQPEFIMLNGFDAVQNTAPASSSRIAGNHNVVFLELFGGMDWIYGVLPKDQYTDYVELRSILAIPYANMNPSGEHFFSDAMDDFTTLYSNGNLMMFHGVGLPAHSRGHDTAQRQSTSARNEQKFGAQGVFGQLIANDDAKNTIVLGSVKPNVFSQGQYTNIGRNSAEIRFGGNWAALPNTVERDAMVDSIKTILSNRVYPGTTESTFSGALALDTIATIPGQNAPGYQLSGQLAYIQKLMNNNYGHAFYAVGGGGYDTHANQQDANYLGNKLEYFVDDVSHFFNNFSTPGETLTIVIHTEFGRTIKRNGSDGTDHGAGGGIYLISNNPSVLSTFPEKTYGNIALKKDKRDWLGVGIDNRSVYGRLFDALYNGNAGYTNPYPNHNLDDDVDQLPAQFAYLRPEFTPHSWNASQLAMKFEVEDKNFDPHEMAGFIYPAVGTTATGLNAFNFWQTRHHVLGENDGHYQVVDGGNAADSMLYYSIDLMDNQHVITPHSGAALMPTIYGASVYDVPTNKHAILRAFENTQLSGVATPLTTGIILNTGNYQAANTTHITLKVNTGTQITTLRGSGTWNGAFLLPWSLDVDAFVSQDARELLTNQKLDDMTIDELFVVGPDTLGIGADVQADVELEVGNLRANAAYTVLHSSNGKDWDTIATGVTTNGAGTLSFLANQFSYFALASDEVSCTLEHNKLPGVYQYELVRNAPNATALTIDNGIGAVTGMTGATQLTMPEDIVRTYTMTASNAGSSVTCDTTISTELNIVLTPPSCSLQAVNNDNGTVTLTWTGTDALVANIDQNVGDVSNGTGTLTVNAFANQNITYTMTVLGVNANNTCSDSVYVTANQPNPNGFITNPNNPNTSSSTSGPSGGGKGSGLTMDSCPDQNGDGKKDRFDDYSPSYYDRDCGTPPSSTASTTDNNQSSSSSNTSNTSDNSSTTSNSSNGSNSSSQTTNTVSDQDIVTWMHEHGLTKFALLEDYEPNAPVLREQAAKFYKETAEVIFDKSLVKNGKTCDFKDLDRAHPGLRDWICDSFYMEIFNGGSNGKFVPKMRMRQSHTWTTAIKIIFGELAKSDPWYKTYYDKADEIDILPGPFTYNKADDVVTRIQMGRMLYNAAQWYETNE